MYGINKTNINTAKNMKTIFNLTMKSLNHTIFFDGFSSQFYMDINSSEGCCIRESRVYAEI